jgi:hypothetical protein
MSITFETKKRYNFIFLLRCTISKLESCELQTKEFKEEKKALHRKDAVLHLREVFYATTLVMVSYSWSAVRAASTRLE